MITANKDESSPDTQPKDPFRKPPPSTKPVKNPPPPPPKKR
jgi:hypothetical protein